MIPRRHLAAWALTHPWPSPAQIEQDLLLTRAICEIANHPLLGEELMFRGGTAMHKLHLPEPLRYSEDLDYVRRTAGAIGPVLTALRALGDGLGFQTASRVGAHPKVLWRTSSDDGVPMRIKIEINTQERSPALPLICLPLAPDTTWWSGSAQVLTFQAAEMVATKIRALFQRSKGRDLFDLWLALTQMNLAPDAILAAFGPYHPEGMTARVAITNLERKVADHQFRTDLDLLLTRPPGDYNIDQAAIVVSDSLLSRLDVP
ncbi:MAG: nucleotidyl transferase AbiEii/AbiGii toxin family protein [Micrococcales bacterium]|nr:nucleotidyl transferase AbiEii/AbiGii toxin family protein [Micrococcales bacterium]